MSPEPITGEGTPASVWSDWQVLRSLVRIEAGTLVPARNRAVVIVPHPDDEVLGAAACLRNWQRCGVGCC